MHKLEERSGSVNEQLQLLTSYIDTEIHRNYKLWPANYIACDLLNGDNGYEQHYTIKEKRQFERRLSRRIDVKNALEVNSYLLMYANPVINKKAINENQL